MVVAATLGFPLAVHNIATALPLGLPTGPIAGTTDDTQAPDFLHDQLMASGWFSLAFRTYNVILQLHLSYLF